MDLNMIHGHPIKVWNEAKGEIQQILIYIAKKRETISYEKLALTVQTIKMSYRSEEFDDMLCQISPQFVT